MCTEVPSRCVALEDACVAPDVLFRVSQLNMAKPAALSAGAVAALIANASLMDLPECHLTGTGAFSWLIHVDLAKQNFMSGGAEPVAKPSDGYCFTKQKSFQGADTPIVVDPQGGFVTVDSNEEKVTFTEITSLNVPVYTDQSGTNAIVLPIHQLRFNSVTMSKDHRCIGEFNPNALDAAQSCAPKMGQSIFTPGGSMDGYIALEEADNVIVEMLGQSLCVLISGDAAVYGDGGAPVRCKRDMTNKIMFQGDWCQSNNQPASVDCADASRFVATFAASAVKAGNACP